MEVDDSTMTEQDKATTTTTRKQTNNNKASKLLHVSLFCLLLLPLVGGLAYYFSIMPDEKEQEGASQSQSSSSETSPTTIEEAVVINGRDGGGGGGDDTVLLTSTKFNDNDDKNESNHNPGSLVKSRAKDDDFDVGDNTFLKQNQWIQQGTRIGINSGKMRYYLQHQSDGNLVLYDETFFVYWHSRVIQVPSSKHYSTTLQTDGNLVTYSRRNGNGRPQVEWASNSPSAQDNDYNIALTRDRDGLMIVRKSNGKIIWSTVAEPAAPAPEPNPPPPAPRPEPNSPPPPPANARITYVPGKLTVRENGLLLSQGLKSRLVAEAGQKVTLDGDDNRKSKARFHEQPDGAAVFSDPDTGGWIYVSNSEIKDQQGQGGVGAIYFDRNARTTNYRMLEDGTTANCSGGKTPWNTWVTCEETEGGRAYQVDPYGKRGMQPITMDRGWFESFAYDIRDQNRPRFFVTEDAEKGPLRRFSPSVMNWNDPWQLLHAPGRIDYLVLEPRGNGSKGNIRWTTDKIQARNNAQRYYPFSEGMDVYRNQLFFTTKERKELFILDLDRETFEKQSTKAGVFDGQPDQIKRIVDDGLLYFCEEGGVENGVHARDENGWFMTILESDTFNDETTGLAFSPNGKRMYVSFQQKGKIFDIWREDGLPFQGQTLDVKYHEFKRR